MIIEHGTIIRAMLVRHLKDSGLEYVDMTERGGCLYFFDEPTAKELTEKGYKVHFAPNGTKSTAGRPAWYVSVR